MNGTSTPDGSVLGRPRRGGIAGLPTPHPLGRTLPGLYLADPVTQQLCAALDEVLAPVVSTLDCYPAHLDPATAPDDAVDWLAGWLGLVPDAHLDPARRRELVRIGSDLLSRRGTVRGLRDAVTALFPGTVEIVDPGGTLVLRGPDAEPGGAGGAPSAPGNGAVPARAPYVLVRLVVDDPATVDRRRLAATVGLLVPAHVPHRTEVVATAAGGANPPATTAAPERERPAGR